MDTTITYEQFLTAAKEFVFKSNKICDGWKIVGEELNQAYLIKETFVEDTKHALLKAQYVIFYNLSYGVPSFSFNFWYPSGMLLCLDDLRDMAYFRIDEKDFYSVITQQEHPILHKPYFIMHPCHTENLLAAFKDKTIQSGPGQKVTENCFILDWPPKHSEEMEVRDPRLPRKVRYAPRTPVCI